MRDGSFGNQLVEVVGLGGGCCRRVTEFGAVAKLLVGVSGSGERLLGVADPSMDPGRSVVRGGPANRY